MLINSLWVWLDLLLRFRGTFQCGKQSWHNNPRTPEIIFQLSLNNSTLVINLIHLLDVERATVFFISLYPPNFVSWTAWQPYRLSYILGLYMRFFYLLNDHFLKCWQKNVQNLGIWKIDFFWNHQIPIIKIRKKILSFLLKCFTNSWIAWIWFDFYDYSDF